MNTALLLVTGIIVLISSVIIMSKKKSEGFDAAGLVFNRPPEWFNKQAYDPKDWIVAYYPDQLSKPECLYDRGSPEELNILSSAYIFWRM